MRGRCRDAVRGAARLRPTVLLPVLLMLLAPGAARAQFDGWWGGWVGYQTPSVVNDIARRSEVRGANARTMQQPQFTAPVRTGRDVTFFERYDYETRQAMEDRVARRPRNRPPTSVASIPAPSAPKPKPAAPKPKPAGQPVPDRIVVPLESFFGRYEEVVWPVDAPTAGDLTAKRQVSDIASRNTLKEYRERGLATIATVTTSRNALLDYGRPALAYLRANTPAVAETVHSFLLSLYDALGRAGTDPRPGGAK